MEEALVKGLDELGCAYDSQSLSKLSAYVGLVQKWNQRTNLISRKDIKRLLERHLLDSLSVEGFLNDGNVIDIGSGAGFPGMPLAICRPDLEFTLVERSENRSRFLRLARLELNLENVDCLQKDLTSKEALDKKFGTALARAVSDPLTIWRICQASLTDNGKLVFFLSTLPNESLGSLLKLVEGIKGVVSRIQDMHIPGLNNVHKILIIEKNDAYYFDR